ncbi:GDSL lipase/esterase [Dillenia turbinata]|uniref:GDSL lipase/esterase n=1 Tax=Dillenia turbinata TaxID=194707 RepID=A0AAN8W689_9MAGN
MSMEFKVIPWLTLAQVLTFFFTVHAYVPAVIVFGDSSVDLGNNNHIPIILKSDFEPYGHDFIGKKPTGRFCNGRLATDFISEAFELKKIVPAYLDPDHNIIDFANRVCFASAGTSYDNATSDVLNVIPLWKEVEYFKEYQERLRGYLGNAKANEVLGEALYLISIGTNDFLENYYLLPQRKYEFSEEEYGNFLIGIASNFVTELYKLGARKISLGGLPPMGCVPLERTTEIFFGSVCVGKYNDVTHDFNEKLKTQVEQLNKQLLESDWYFQTYMIFSWK